MEISGNLDISRFMKRRVKDLSESEKIATLDALYTAAGTVKGRAAMKKFLKELLTESERIMLGRRILIARLILKGHKEKDIARNLRVGVDTIWRVKKWLDKQMPGYAQAVKSLEKEYKKRNDPHSAKATLARLKKSYPLHFLLFPPYK